MKIGIVNSSTRVTSADFIKMVTAVAIQMDSQVAPAWDRLSPQIRMVDDPKTLAADEAVIALVDKADDPGALGWHSEDNSGRAIGYVFVNPVLENGGGVLDGGISGVSVASVVSHEVIELFGDIDVNDYDDGPESGHGMCYAHELCDPCEADGYTVKLPDDTAVLVSNFVLPAWFDQNAPAGSLFDFMGTCKAPFTMSAGGYMVVRNAPGSEQQVFGEVAPPAWRLEGKRRPGSRTARRMGIGE